MTETDAALQALISSAEANGRAVALAEQQAAQGAAVEAERAAAQAVLDEHEALRAHPFRAAQWMHGNERRYTAARATLQRLAR